MQTPCSGSHAKRDGNQRYADYHSCYKRIKAGLDRTQISHQGRHGEMARRASSTHQGSNERSRTDNRDADTNPYHRGLHRGEAKREQHCVLTASVGVHVMQQIGSEGSRQRCCRHRNDREEGQRLRKVGTFRRN